MAKTQTPSADTNGGNTNPSSAVVAAPVGPAVAAAAAGQAEGPTPDNTPVPGGGRWRWDIAKPGWVSNEPEPDPVPDAAAAADPTTPE